MDKKPIQKAEELVERLITVKALAKVGATTGAQSVWEEMKDTAEDAITIWKELGLKLYELRDLVKTLEEDIKEEEEEEEDEVEEEEEEVYIIARKH